VDLGKLNWSPEGTPVVAKATHRDGHEAGPSPEQPSVTPVLLTGGYGQRPPHFHVITRAWSGRDQGWRFHNHFGQPVPVLETFSC